MVSYVTAVLKIAHFKEQVIFALFKARYKYANQHLRQKYDASNLLRIAI